MNMSPDVPLWTAVLAGALLYGLRYAAFALTAHALVLRHPGTARHNAQTIGNRGAHIRREIGYSTVTIAVFAAVIAAMHGSGLLAHTRLYFSLHDKPLWWFPASILCMLALHDTFFYWMHRVFHSRLLFRAVHLVHHKSVQPTSFAAYSFHPWEALGEALIVTAILFIVPSHPLAFVIFQTISTAYNVYGHCGRELYPEGTAKHWLGKWLNTSTLHADHHRRAKGNYSLYFTFWDRWMGTLLPLEQQPAASRRPLAQAQPPAGFQA